MKKQLIVIAIIIFFNIFTFAMEEIEEGVERDSRSRVAPNSSPETEKIDIDNSIKHLSVLLKYLYVKRFIRFDLEKMNAE